MKSRASSSLQLLSAAVCSKKFEGRSGGIDVDCSVPLLCQLSVDERISDVAKFQDWAEVQRLMRYGHLDLSSGVLLARKTTNFLSEVLTVSLVCAGIYPLYTSISTMGHGPHVVNVGTCCTPSSGGSGLQANTDLTIFPSFIVVLHPSDIENSPNTPSPGSS